MMHTSTTRGRQRNEMGPARNGTRPASATKRFVYLVRPAQPCFVASQRHHLLSVDQGDEERRANEGQYDAHLELAGARDEAAHYVST